MRASVAKNEVGAIVLAAGESKRFRSSRSKLVHPFGGRPMIQWPLQALREIGVRPIVVVVGHSVHFLPTEGEAGGDHALRPQRGDGEIEIAGAPAQPVALPVEGEKRHQKESGRNLGRARGRFEDAEHALHQRLAGRPCTELQSPPPARHAGQGQAVTATGESCHERAAINLVGDRPVTRHHGAGGRSRCRQKAIRHVFADAVSCSFRGAPAGGAAFTA